MTVPPIRVGESFVKLLAGSHMSRAPAASDTPRFASPSVYTVGRQAPSTKEASFSPGHGGIVAPIALRGSCPSQRN